MNRHNWAKIMAVVMAERHKCGLLRTSADYRHFVKNPILSTVNNFLDGIFNRAESRSKRLLRGMTLDGRLKVVMAWLWRAAMWQTDGISHEWLNYLVPINR